MLLILFQINLCYCLVQEDYEVTPDEKRKSRGDQIIKTFLSKEVSFFISCLMMSAFYLIFLFIFFI